MTLYKWLTPDRTTTYQREPWPVRAKVWTPAETPKLCKTGWHLATLAGVAAHLPQTFPAVLWEAEGRGTSDARSDKIAFEQARILRPIGTLTEKGAHILACDFALHTLGNYESAYPDDDRPRRAIEVKRLWLEGKATDEELAAAWSGAAPRRRGRLLVRRPMAAARSVARSAASAALAARGAAESAAESRQGRPVSRRPPTTAESAAYAAGSAA